MSNFRKVREQIEEKLSDKVQVRKDYRCAAHGCPNAGSVNDKSEFVRGVCGVHYQYPASEWPEVTAQIQRSGLRNHGDQPPRKSSRLVEEMRARMQSDAPMGLINGQTGGKL